MGPLTRVVPVSEFEAWIGSAATGAQIAYADGYAAPRATATFHLAREMSDAGYVDLFTRKVDGRTEWLARRKRPVEVAAAAARARCRSEVWGGKWKLGGGEECRLATS